MAVCLIVSLGTAEAAAFETIYIFGDSFSDSGARAVLSDGGTAASHLAEQLGNPAVLPDAAVIGSSSVNFAESSARIGVDGPDGPVSLTGQVDTLVSLVQTGAATFDPDTTLFFLSGGLNDPDPNLVGEVTAAYRKQVADLVDLGARHIHIALLPREVPEFTISADLLNPAFRQLVPELDTRYADVSVTLSHWGPYYDDIVMNPDAYGFTNVTDPCRGGGYGPATSICHSPETYFYYWVAHPSDAAHRVVADRLYGDILDFGEAACPPTPETGICKRVGHEGHRGVR